jgi:glutamate racemase
MIWVFDSGFGGLQTLKYFKKQFPHDDFLFLADTKHLPYGNKSKENIKALTVANINRLFEQWCSHVVIACNTAVASVYEHWFQADTEKKLIAVTRCGLKETILYNYKKIAVMCTQATHDMAVYPTIYKELQWTWELYTIPTPELVPLIEASVINYDKVYYYMELYSKYITPDTDCLIMWCTHYPVLITIFWEQFPQLKIIDPWRSSIFTLDKRISQSLQKKYQWRGSLRICCTGSVDVFKKWATKIWKTHDLPDVFHVSVG